MHKPLRFGLIGIGGIGAYHRAAIESREKQGEVLLVAVADPTAVRLKKAKEELVARGVRWYMDYQEMLATEQDLDAVVIATPIPFHFEMALACIQRGLYVNLEKPPVPMLSQLETLIKADAARKVNVGFQMIGSQCMQKLKEVLTGGKLGTIREVRAAACWPRRDGYYNRAGWAGKMVLNGSPVFDGPATNALAHLLHNIMFLASADPCGFARPSEIEGELYRARSIETYDTACMRGQFESGIEFSFCISHATLEEFPFQIEVRGTEGFGRISMDGSHLETSCGITLEQPESTQQLIDVNYARFVDVILGRQERFATCLEDTCGYVAATNALFRSSGGIHSIPAKMSVQYVRQGEGGYDVPGLCDVIKQSLVDGKLFYERNLPWADCKPQVISMTGLQSVTLEELEAAAAGG